MFLTSDYVLGGLASMGAAFFTNPIEIIKIRMQLQGELAKRGTYIEPYKSVLGALVKIVQNEGILAVNKGLLPALYFQFITNSMRFGLYTTALEKGWASNENHEISFLRLLFWGGIGGILGAFFSSPFFMLKTQLQAQAAEAIAVGHQHTHTGMLHGLKSIYRKNGIFGLWNGATANMMRACVVSGAQIAIFDWTKSKLHNSDLVTQPALNSFCGGLLAGTVMSIIIAPPDIISTRLYNQPLDEHSRGKLYKNSVDCFKKISKTEGALGFYKGFWPTYVRYAPHSTIALLFFDELRAYRDRLLKKA